MGQLSPAKHLWWIISSLRIAFQHIFLLFHKMEEGFGLRMVTGFICIYSTEGVVNLASNQNRINLEYVPSSSTARWENTGKPHLGSRTWQGLVGTLRSHLQSKIQNQPWSCLFKTTIPRMPQVKTLPNHNAAGRDAGQSCRRRRWPIRKPIPVHLPLPAPPSPATFSHLASSWLTVEEPSAQGPLRRWRDFSLWWPVGKVSYLKPFGHQANFPAEGWVENGHPQGGWGLWKFPGCLRPVRSRWAGHGQRELCDPQRAEVLRGCWWGPGGRLLNRIWP